MLRLLTRSLLLADALALVARAPPLRRAHPRARVSATRALYEDDPWLTSGEAAPCFMLSMIVRASAAEQ